MIYIRKGQANTCVFTLNEKATTTSHNWVFVFTNDTTGSGKTFTAFELSSTTARYNKFTITESSTENLYNGTVSLSPTGYWSYTVYEMADTSPTSLVVANALATVETGKAFVYDSTENVNYTFTTDNTKSNSVFTG